MFHRSSSQRIFHRFPAPSAAAAAVLALTVILSALATTSPALGAPLSPADAFLPVLAASLPVLVAGDGSSTVPDFDADRAFQLLRRQVEMGPRNPGSEGHAACLRWLRGYLDEQGALVREQAFTVKDPYGEGVLHLTNLWAAFGPAEKERVAVAAHWDTRPRADRQPGGAVDQPIPGANDGASGVAVLLELARLLHEHPVKGVGVDLLFFDGEDYGREGDTAYYLLGSRRFVLEHGDYHPQALILLDMVGGKDLSIFMERNGLDYAGELSFEVFSRAAELGLPAFVSQPGPRLLDDHVPFLQAGIPAVDLIDFDYPQWHTLQDDVAACSAQSLAQVGRLMVSLLYEGLSR